MIQGIGIDIVEIDRIKRIVENCGEGFLGFTFTLLEIDEYKRKNCSVRQLAGKFAIKEAVLKAFNIGWQKGIKWKDIEVKNSNYKSPMVNLYGRIKFIADELCIKNIFPSISYCKVYAVGLVIIER